MGFSKKQAACLIKFSCRSPSHGWCTAILSISRLFAFQVVGGLDHCVGGDPGSAYMRELLSGQAQEKEAADRPGDSSVSVVMLYMAKCLFTLLYYGPGDCLNAFYDLPNVAVCQADLS